MQCPAMATKSAMYGSPMFNRSISWTFTKRLKSDSRNRLWRRLSWRRKPDWFLSSNWDDRSAVYRSYGMSEALMRNSAHWEFVSPIYVWCICERALLWMPPKPHLVYQVGKFLHTSHRMFHCVGHLVAAGEGVPYLDDKDTCSTRISLPSDFNDGLLNLCLFTCFPEARPVSYGRWGASLPLQCPDKNKPLQPAGRAAASAPTGRLSTATGKAEAEGVAVAIPL
jgi:hypothetical protein